MAIVIEVLNPNPSHYIFSSQKGKGMKPMCVQTFSGFLKEIMKEYKIKYIGNSSFHPLGKTLLVGSIKKGFENGDHLSLVKVSRLIGHSNVSATLRYTNLQTNQILILCELG